ncbi:MAG: retropepsin-like aspartic protease [Candidatus Omnitrophota bacterium]
MFSAVSAAMGDTLYLKNGRKIKGVIQRDTPEYVDLGVGSGSVRFYRAEIERIEFSSEEQNRGLEKNWEIERLRKEERLAEHRRLEKEIEDAMPKEAEVRSKDGHLFVNALLNRKTTARFLVDTGASMIVVSAQIAKKLNVDIKGNDASEINITLADGREISGRYFKLDTISVGEAVAEDIDAAVILQEDAFTDFDGVLGMSFLKLFKFSIDPQGNKFILNK